MLGPTRSLGHGVTVGEAVGDSVIGPGVGEAVGPEVGSEVVGADEVGNTVGKVEVG